jgi:hypothetical protein
MCRSISLPSIPTGGCAMCRERRPPRSILREELRSAPGYVTFTRGILMTSLARAPIVTPAAAASSAGTGTRSPPGRSTKTVAARVAESGVRAFSKNGQGCGARAACRSRCLKGHGHSAASRATPPSWPKFDQNSANEDKLFDFSQCNSLILDGRFTR